MESDGIGRVAAGFTVAVGLVILGLWTALILTGNVPELVTASLEIGYHLAAELLTAALLVAAGGGLLTRKRWAGRLYPIALGMLLYTVINSAGYYAQLGAVEVVAMFGILTVATGWLIASFVADRGRRGAIPAGIATGEPDA